MKDNPLVTVAIPAYNAENTIAETLESILRQNYSNLEVIVVDDGSHDATPAIVRGIGKSDSRVRLVQQENLGVAAARNRGIMEGHGDFIAPMDHDDLWHPEMIEKAMMLLKPGAGRLGFVYAWYRCIDEESMVLRDGPQYVFRGHILNRHLLVNPVRTGSGLLMTRTAALDAGYYDTSLRRAGLGGPEDLALQLAIAEKYEVDLVPEFLVGYRMGTNTMSQHSAQICHANIELLKSKFQAHPELHPAVRRWVLGARNLRYATALARELRVLDALAALTRALGLNPMDVLASGFGLIQLGARKLWNRKQRDNRVGKSSLKNPAGKNFVRAPRHFLDFDPRESANKRTWTFVETLRQSQLRKLEAMDLESTWQPVARTAAATANPKPALKHF